VLLPERNTDELRDLYTRFDVEQSGPTYFQPLMRSGEVIAVLMLGMPYSGRELTQGEQETLKTIGILGANLLAITNTAKDQRVKAEGRIIQAMVRGVSPDEIPDSDVVASWEDMHRQLDAARDQIVQLSRNVTNLKIQLDDERSRVTTALSDTEEGLSVTGRMLAMTEDQQRLIDERDQLNARLRDAEAKLASATVSGDAGLFQAMIDVLNREKDDLQKQRDALMLQISDLRAAGDATVPDAMREMLDRMSEEKTRLEGEREGLRERVSEIEGQLTALGIEGGVSGLASLITNLMEQQAQLQTKYDTLKREGDGASNAELSKLRGDLANLAADREAISKQREMMRADNEELTRRLDTLKEQRGRVMAEAAAYQQELTEAHVQQAQIRVSLQRALEERSALTSERDMLRAEKVALEADRDGLLARVEGDRERLAQLGQDGVGSLTSMIDELTQARAALERDLLQAQLENSDLANRLEVAQIRSISQPASPEPALVDQFAGLVHGYRTSMTPIIEYVDLLLGESAGILGDMQRKFLLRVASNARRLWTMTDGLQWLTALDTGRYSANRTQVNMVEVIEEAITRSAVPLREKDLTIHLDLDDDLPPLNADAEAMNQVVGQLVTNAYLACEPGGSLAVSVRHQRLRLPRGDASAEQVDALVGAVSDSGVGIAPEDQASVFARRYKLENPLIPGLGDTGVGLAIAKQLMEVHGGDIWFETGERGTTFFFAIPY
jgi:signal transduction histidine kinase